MIDFYTWTTPNGRKVSIMLEECNLDYSAHAVNLTKDEQFSRRFLKISPNNKIPAIVDHDGEDGPISVFESGAILIYLARKTGKFLPQDPAGEAEVLQWLMWQMGGVGPMLGQLNHFFQNAETAGDYGVQRFMTEAQRLFGVLDRHLANVECVAGTYSIADMALYPWIKAALTPVSRAAEAPFEHVQRWISTLEARPAVGRGMRVPAVS